MALNWAVGCQCRSDVLDSKAFPLFRLGQRVIVEGQVHGCTSGTGVAPV